MRYYELDSMFNNLILNLLENRHAITLIIASLIDLSPSMLSDILLYVQSESND